MSLPSLGRLLARGLEPEEPTNAIQEELYSSWAFLILVILLIATLWTSYYLQLNRIRAVHETVLSIFGGVSLSSRNQAPSVNGRNDCRFDYQT